MAAAQLVIPVHLVAGALLAAIGGSVNGLFAFPMRWNKRWAWENYWLPFSLLALGLFPSLAAFCQIDHPLLALRSVPSSDLLMGLVCGIFVYSGSLLFGIAIDLIGAALAFSLLVGSMSLVGTILPIVLFHRQSITGRNLAFLELAGLCFVVAMILNTKAGLIRQELLRIKGSEDRLSGNSLTGIAFAVIGGALSGLLSLGMELSWSREVVSSAIAFGGASQTTATSLPLLLVLLGGVMPNCLYAAVQLFRKRTNKNFTAPGAWTGYAAVLVMAVLYYGSLLLWGISISPGFLGANGPSVGWGIFIGSIVLSSTIGGIVAGEWKTAKSAYPWLGSAALFISFAVVLVALASAHY